MPDLAFESAYRSGHHRWIAGVDEAGRGPLAGPVTAAAVILPLDFQCSGLDDSKKVRAAQREILFEKITQNPAVIWSVASSSHAEIDALNILRATHFAMRRALEGLTQIPDFCLIDGLPIKNFPFAHQGIVKGDGLSLSIAAASIIAKVTRDRFMRELDKEFPQFGFARHHGYGTKAHLEALRTHGPCCQHRRSFRPVAHLTLSLDK